MIIAAEYQYEEIKPLDAAGSAAAPASGEVTEKEDDASLSGADGRFSLYGVSKSKSLRLRITLPGFVTRIVKVKEYDGGRRDLGDIVLEAGGSISGYVTDEAGKGINNAETTAKPKQKRGGSAFFELSSLLNPELDWKVQTTADGFYRITGLPTGKVKIEASHPDHAAAEKNNISVTAGRETAKVNIVLTAGGFISGMVTDTNSSPIEGARIRIEHEIEITLENLSDLDNIISDITERVRRIVTDSQGVFRAKGLKGTCYTVKAGAAGFAPFEEKKVKTGTENLEIVLQKCGWIAGKVTDEKTGLGIEEFSIEVDRDGWSNDLETLKGEKAAAAMRPELSDHKGAFHISGFASEEIEILVKAKGYADKKIAAIKTYPGEGVDPNIELCKESIISGRLISFSGEPVPGGELALEVSNPDEADALTTATVDNAPPEVKRIGESVSNLLGVGWDKVKGTESTKDGSFALTGLSAGVYRIIASHDKHMDSSPVELEISPGEVLKDIEIRLRAAGSIAGTVYAADSSLFPGATVLVCKAGGLGSLLMGGNKDGSFFDRKTANSGADGTFCVNGLAPGMYRVKLTNELDEDSIGGIVNTQLSGMFGQAEPGEIEVRVEQGKTTHVELHQTLKGGITGTVLEAGQPVEDMKVKLFKGGLGFLAIIPLKTTGTDRNGTYLFRDMKEGNYELKIDLAGQADPIKKMVILEPGGMASADFILPCGRVTGTVSDKATGELLAGIKISVKRGGKKKSGNAFFEAFGISASTGLESSGEGINTATEVNGVEISGHRHMETDADGRYEIRFVADGEHILTASGKGYITHKLSPVKVIAGGETVCPAIELSRGITVTGRVLLDATGKPAEQAYITCSMYNEEAEEWKKVKKPVFCRKDGAFSISGLEPGRYRFKARKGAATDMKEITLKEADVNGVEMRL